MFACGVRAESRMEVSWGQRAEQYRAPAGRIWNQRSWVRCAYRESIDQVFGPQSGDVAKQHRRRAEAQHSFHVPDSQANGRVQTSTLIGYDDGALLAHEGRSMLIRSHDDQMSRRYAGDCCGDRVQGERMSQISPCHPGGRMQTALGGQLAFDRDD